MDNTRILALIQFLSTLSLRRATLPRRSTLTAATDFYPRSPCGERLDRWLAGLKGTLFLSTLSLRRATRLMFFWLCGRLFLSTLSLRRATTRERTSIKPIFNFYPRSPCGERLFLCCDYIFRLFISIHALLAESDKMIVSQVRERAISIHALLAESDQPSTPGKPTIKGISIHALLAESDPYSLSQSVKSLYFYPRSPCGERQMDNTRILALIQFLSTLSLRRATS